MALYCISKKSKSGKYFIFGWDEYKEEKFFGFIKNPETPKSSLKEESSNTELFITEIHSEAVKLKKQLQEKFPFRIFVRTIEE